MPDRRLLATLALSILFLAACAPAPKSEGGGGSAGGGESRETPSYEGIPADGEPVPGGVLLRNLTSEPELINPALSSGLSAAYIEEEVFNHIVMYDSDLDYKPQLAASWERSDDNLVYTFKLRSGLTWHDGKPLSVATKRIAQSTNLPIC